MAVILVGGGARSGKSSYALRRAREFGGQCVFVATATAYDDDYARRIARHRSERGDDFPVIEEPTEIARVIENATADVLLIDCLTLWLANLLGCNRDVDEEMEKLAVAARSSKSTVIFVTNEVGCGVVPETEIGCKFRDHAGFLNQRIADVADEIYWMVFGQPLRVK